MLLEDHQIMGFSNHKALFPQLTLPGTVQRICTHSVVVGCMNIRETISGYTNTCWAFLWLSFSLSSAQNGSSYSVKSTSLVWTQRGLEWFCLNDKAHTTPPRKIQIILLDKILLYTFNSTLSLKLLFAVISLEPSSLRLSLSAWTLQALLTIF